LSACEPSIVEERLFPKPQNRRKRMTPVAPKKWVYHFSEGNAQMVDLLGGKGAGLAEMTQAQIPVPPGFTITTEACRAYYDASEQFPDGMWEQVLEAVGKLEIESGKHFGDPANPLLVSVRSGSPISMPGMMDTVLNLGLNHQTLLGLANSEGGERFAYDAYRRFIQMYGKIVLGVPGGSFDATLESYKRSLKVTNDTDLTAENWKLVTKEFLTLIKEQTGVGFPQDPLQQLRLAIGSVFASWNNKRAIDYRNFHRISHFLSTAVNVVTMVFGNMGETSGTGVTFTRDPSTGERKLFGEYLANAQGEDVVAGIRTPQEISHLATRSPKLYHQLEDIALRLEYHYRDAQDIEFTVELGKLFLLQTRSAKRTGPAAVKIAVDMVSEGLISREEAIQRVEAEHVNQLLLPRFDENAKSKGILLATGLNASLGAASGKAVFDPDIAEEMGHRGESVILIRQETNPDDVHGMIQAKGILTALGGATSHAAVVARMLGKPCITGCQGLEVDSASSSCTIGGQRLNEGDWLSLDGSTGEVFIGAIPTTETHVADLTDLTTLLSWADEMKSLEVWANADYPVDAARALEFGAQGIGLCRTEHMFFEKNRLPIVRQMILTAAGATELEARVKTLEAGLSKLNASEVSTNKNLAEAREQLAVSKVVADYHQALDQLLEFQIQDFRGLLEIMEGKPVVIRLLDPPLHEFLPRYDELIVRVTELRIRGDDPTALAENRQLLQAVEAMREINPMLGLRGCRLGLMYGAINEMQVRAIFTAACTLAKEGIDVRPEIMVPLVGHVNEIRIIRRELERIAQLVQTEHGVQVPYKFGTMVEVPRAALTANEIAQEAEFFSFGTNDLTQTTFGYSRDDAETKFLQEYVNRGILPENPFQVLDRPGVGKLIEMAVALGRESNPDLEIGICGEHGGDPSSIEFCHSAGLDYVSASPFRVPIARLAAAQAALKSPRTV
jgi:pyruvate,orthophosphate dikinase